MRRILTTALLALAAGALFVFGSGAEDDSSSGYEIRAAFDNGSFLVPGEVVRVAGADVGVIESTEVSREDEIIALDPEPHAEPGKAIVVMKITDPAFQDFREDASCIIRPQSLLGERFVDCEATQPRAPGTEPPPELGVIEDGQPGEGQHLLPLEANGKAVDLDLVNNIMRRPYRERFSIILNELGAGLAARGDELGDIIERADPALRETDKILATLADQDKTLARLARDSNEVLAPLARQRAKVAGFIDKSGDTAEASAERRADIERQFQLLPPTLRELRSVMIELRRFNDEAIPVFADLGDAAPAITGATKALGPLADAATPSLTSLGDALEEAAPDLVASQPVLQRRLRPRQRLRATLEEPLEAARRPAAKGRLRAAARRPLQRLRLRQRPRPVRPLPAHAVPRLQLHRLRDRAAHRLPGQLPPNRGRRAPPTPSTTLSASAKSSASSAASSGSRPRRPTPRRTTRTPPQDVRARRPLRRRRQPRPRGDDAA